MLTRRTRLASNPIDIEPTNRFDAEALGLRDARPQLAPSPRPSPHDRRHRRQRRLVALALTAASAVGVVAVDHVVVAGERAIVEPEPRSAAPSNRACRGIWDQVLVLGIPEAAWPSAARQLGFAQTGEWLSADGLTWEHFDGRVVVVATPRTNSDRARSCHAVGRSRS